MEISNLIIDLQRPPRTGPVRVRVVKSSNVRGEPMVFDFKNPCTEYGPATITTFPKMCCGQPVITEPKLIGRDPVNICRVTDKRATDCSGPPKFLPKLDLLFALSPNPNGVAITRRFQ